MLRREFLQAATSVAAIGGSVARSVQSAGSPEPKAIAAVMGTNLSGLEWAAPGLRHSLSSAPNIHFTVPRKADVVYLAGCGFTKNRLPVQWELLQPMLPGTQASAVAKKLIGEPGSFHTGYAAYITALLDAHAASGIRCIIDLHNYARYRDFKYQADGSVIGLKAAPEPWLRPYTLDKAQLQTRIFALGEGATLTPAQFADFWRRAASLWGGHPGLGGYGLMNEPFELPERGSIVESKRGRDDLMILPVFMQAAIDTIRAIDTTTPIYVGGNEWSNAGSVAVKNPGYPLRGAGLIYEVHSYLDRRSTGAAFDWESEAGIKKIAGPQAPPITNTSGRDRIQVAIDWAKAKGVKLALGEIGMPVDDPRWAESFKNTIDLALQHGVEVYSWLGGNHWPIRSHPLSHAPGWHQNKTLEPLVSSVMKASAGIAQAALFDDGPGHAHGSKPVTITVYARGNLARPARLSIMLNGKGKLSKTQVTIPAGANGQDSYTVELADNQVALISYTTDSQPQVAVPPPRKVFSLANPVAHAGTNLGDAAMAIIAKYSACKWEMADAYTDYMQGAPATQGQLVRAVSDSGYGSSPGNAMEMINWINLEGEGTGGLAPPVMRLASGKKSAVFETGMSGLWCKKSVPEAGVRPNPQSRAPYNIEDAHFAVVAMAVSRKNSTGLVFQASQAEENHATELGLVDSQPVVRWIDVGGRKVELISPDKLALNKVASLGFTSAPGEQTLRVNSALVAGSRATFAPGVFSQMLIGWGHRSYYPQDGFTGNIYAAVTGKGVPLSDELAVLERYLTR